MLNPYQQRQHNQIKQNSGDPLLGTLGTIAGTAAGAALGGPAGAAAGAALGSQLGNVASGAPINPGEMAVSGLTSGMGSADKAVKSAQAGLGAAKDSLAKEAAQDALASAKGNPLYNPFDKITDKGKDIFNSIFDDYEKDEVTYKADGGEVNRRGSVFDDMSKLEKFAMFTSPMFMGSQALGMQPEKMMMGPLAAMMLNEGGKAKQPKRDREGRIIPEELPENLDFSKMRLAPLTKMTEAQKQQEAAVRQQLEAKKKKAAMLAKGGKACCGKPNCGCGGY